MLKNNIQQSCKRALIKEIQHGKRSKGYGKQYKRTYPLKRFQHLPGKSVQTQNIYKPSSRVQCEYCKRNISKGPKTIAITAENQCLSLCMSCFANAQPLPENYHVANKLDFPLLEPLWTALEELLLFEGLQIHGFGNWTDISEYIGTGKSREQVEEHYQQVFLANQDFIPKTDIISTRNQTGTLKCQKMQVQAPVQPEYPKQTAFIPVVRVSSGGAPPVKQSTTPAEVVGFMWRRGDFQIQYDNDAQLLLAEMQFNEDDSQQEKNMKFRLIDIYNHKLDERIKRKNFVISRKLLDIREQMRLDKTRTREEKQIHNLMRVIARFNTPQQHEQLVHHIIKEKQIRQRIAELKELQNKGLKTWGEVEDELESKKKRDDKNKKKEEPYAMDKSKTRRVARKDTTQQRSEKRLFYISREEEQLCHKLNLTFRQYSALKEKIMRQSVKQGMLSRDQATQGLQVSKRTAQAVFDFLAEQEELMVEKKEEMVAEQ